MKKGAHFMLFFIRHFPGPSVEDAVRDGIQNSVMTSDQWAAAINNAVTHV